jgi:hypothetical protein
MAEREGFELSRNKGVRQHFPENTPEDTRSKLLLTSVQKVGEFEAPIEIGGSHLPIAERIFRSFYLAVAVLSNRRNSFADQRDSLAV